MPHRIDFPRLSIRLYTDIDQSDDLSHAAPCMDAGVYLPHHLCARVPMLPYRLSLQQERAALVLSGLRIEVESYRCTDLCRDILTASKGIVPLVHALAARAALEERPFHG
jgi:hypothetical protein